MASRKGRRSKAKKAGQRLEDKAISSLLQEETMFTITELTFRIVGDNDEDEWNDEFREEVTEAVELADVDYVKRDLMRTLKMYEGRVHVEIA